MGMVEGVCAPVCVQVVCIHCVWVETAVVYFWDMCGKSKVAESALQQVRVVCWPRPGVVAVDRHFRPAGQSRPGLGADRGRDWLPRPRTAAPHILPPPPWLPLAHSPLSL